MSYVRGDIVKGPDLVGPHTFRPWLLLSDDSHPFGEQEGLWAVITTTSRSSAIPLGDSDLESGALPKQSFVNPWNITTIKFADMYVVEATVTESVADQVAEDAAKYMGITAP